jgi:hypothetical protein
MSFGPVSIFPGVLSTWDVSKSAPFATKDTAVIGNAQLGLFTFMDQLRQGGWSVTDAATGVTTGATWMTPGAEPVYLSITEHTFSMFQLMFAIVTVAIISGAVVGRIKYAWFMAFAAIWHLVIYCPLAHWIFFYDGWLFTFGVLDYAGGLVVHLASGASALTLAYWLGNSKRAKHDPHSVPYVLLGAALLWFGWFGFVSRIDPLGARNPPLAHLPGLSVPPRLARPRAHRMLALRWAPAQMWVRASSRTRSSAPPWP